MLNTECQFPTNAGDHQAEEPPAADRRRSRRISVGAEVTVTILTPESCPITGIVENASTGGIRLMTDTPLARKALIQIHFDNLLLGEVIYCQPVDGRYAVGLQIGQSLDLNELARLLNSRLLPDD